jgi:hypothetical protein
MLNKYYPDLFNIYTYENYNYIQNKIELPKFMYTCDYFIYQNYSYSDNDYNLQNILNNILPKKCISISFPTLHRNYLQFPFDINSPENKNSINKKYPHGYFFYGIGVIRDIVNTYKNNNIKEIKKIVLNKMKEINFISINNIEKYEQDTIIFLKNKALKSDIPYIYDFIINNYKKKRLYHNPNHPNGILLNELCKQIFYKMNLNYCDDKTNIELLDNLLKDWKMPIFNSVINYYNMENIDNNCYSLYHDDIKDIETYVNKYVDFLINN